MVPDYTHAGIIRHRFFEPLFEDIYGMEIFSDRPVDAIDLLTCTIVVFHS